MDKFKKALSLLLTLALLVSMAACTGDPETTDPTSGEPVNTGTYNVSIRSQGGMALSGIDV